MVLFWKIPVLLFKTPFYRNAVIVMAALTRLCTPHRTFDIT
jgi:hypothetical protein